MKSMIAPLALACGMAAAQAPNAPAVYRCGDSYGALPCAGGRAVATDTPLPTAAESRQSAAAARRDAKLADGLEQERLKQEARPMQVHVVPAPAQETFEPHRWPQQKATRKLDVFTATAPAPASAGKDKAAKPGKKKAAEKKAQKEPPAATPRPKA